jgi:acetoin utilization deacetylase AcuC-like enzyme
VDDLPLEVGKLNCWYADHQAVTLPDGHRFPMDKYRMTRQLLQNEVATSKIASFHPSPPAPLEDLYRAHSPAYVQRFLTGDLSDTDMRTIGFPWSPSVVARNLASVGGTLAATTALLLQPSLQITAHISGEIPSAVYLGWLGSGGYHKGNGRK